MSSGYECFHCGQKTVHWLGDFSFEDFMLEGEGVVHECKCSNCGAEIMYSVPIPDEEEETDASTES